VTTGRTGVHVGRLACPGSAAATTEAVEVESGSNSIRPETLAEARPKSVQIAHITGP